MERIDVKIGDKEYTVQVAKTEEEKTTGLSKIKELPDDEGMLFEYDEPQELYFTMADTNIDLDIIFITGDLTVVQVNSVKAKTEEPIYCELAKLVLEVNINSGIKEGDTFEFVDSTLTDEDKKQISQSKMLVLDSDGNVQMKLEGGERIISIKDSQKLIKKIITAYHTDNDSDYIKVGKLIFSIFDKLDNLEPEYVQLTE